MVPCVRLAIRRGVLSTTRCGDRRAVGSLWWLGLALGIFWIAAKAFQIRRIAKEIEAAL